MSDVRDRGRGRPHDVAIVGMACVMPGSPDLEAFWANIVDGRDCVTEVPPSRWNPHLFYDASYDGSRRDPGESPMSVSKWGGFVPDVGFDALAWGIPPASLASIDPAQLLALKVAADALDDAGYGECPGQRPFDRDRASVVFATGSGGAADLQAGVMLRILLRCHGVTGPLPPDLEAFLPKLTEDGLPGALTSLISGRVANRLDLGGKNLTVDSACASVLVALEIACDDIHAGNSDLVLCGGVDLHNGAGDYLSFTAAHALSRRGRCLAFDAEADGMTLAEGAGCLVLKRLADAERDGDRIYAVVKGVAGSSDGRHLGVTAPRREGQEKAVRRAYARAGLSPAEVGLVEAHGTGTPVGDRIELQTTTQVFREAGVARGAVVLGSVKSNIGHIKCAAGMAALIKAAKAAYHGVLPPTLHIQRPNDDWDPATSPFVFLDRAHPWLEDERLVGVSSFGFGGTNFHAILQNHTRPARTPSARPVSGRPQWPAELFAFRTSSDADLDARLDDLDKRLAAELTEPRQGDRWRLRDIAAAVTGQGRGPVRLAIVAHDLDDLAAKVHAAIARHPSPGVYRSRDLPGPAAAEPGTGCPRVAFLAPGPEAARLGMAADVLVAFPELRQAAEQADRHAVSVMLPPQPFDDDLERQRTALAEVAGPATSLASLTLARLLVGFGVVPARTAGWGSPLRPGGARGERRDGDPDLAPAARPAIHVEQRPRLSMDEIRRLNDDGIDVFVEVGPGDELTALVDRALADRPHLAVAVDRPGEHGVTSLLHALAQLAVAGVQVDFPALHAGRGSEPERWEHPPAPAGWIVNGHCARTAAGEPLPKGLRPATEAPPIRLAEAGAPVLPGGAQPALTPSEIRVLTEHLRIVEDVISTASAIVQSQVSGNGHGR